MGADKSDKVNPVNSIKNVFKTIAGGVGSVANGARWGLKKTFQKEPQFSLSYYEKDWDRAGESMHHAWDNLGVRIGVKVTAPTKKEEILKQLIREFPNGIAEPMNITDKEKLRDIQIALLEAEATDAEQKETPAVNKVADVLSTSVGAIASSAKVVTETVKTVGLVAGYTAAGAVKQGWRAGLSLKGRLLQKMLGKPPEEPSKELEEPKPDEPSPEDKKQSPDPEEKK